MPQEADLVFLDRLLMRMSVLLELRTLDRVILRVPGWTPSPGLRAELSTRLMELENHLNSLIRAAKPPLSCNAIQKQSTSARQK